MRRATLSVLCGLALAVLIIPAGAFADELPFPYFGGLSGTPLLPCTGFIQITGISGGGTGTTTTWSAVDADALQGLPQCSSLCDLFELANRLLWLALSVLVVVFTPLMIMIGGIYYFTGGGNPGRRATGNKIITGTLIGLAITLCSFLIVNQMLQLIFNRAWGDALRDQAKTQLGLSDKEVEGLFSWDNLTCHVNTINIPFTPGTNPTSTSTTPSSTQR